MENSLSTFPPTSLSPTQEHIIQEAISILASTLREGVACTSAAHVQSYCQLEIATESEELFCALYLNNQHKMVAFEKLFRGTIDSAAVHPRVVVRKALEHNAAAAILVHNHPSGNLEPSQSDKAITKKLKDALSLIDVRTLDHILVTVEGTLSFAEKGLI
ncbi:DNA repair protein RadC [Spongiibacter nanhainus]|uniref:DNA repair protein RadC n=1 Tax=Spongiibacter nanhainus TaxID=2794344 RepID=A0A7T4R3P7_9GAMM|nr:JAB domain-containing protein [Spongiibacter nanhainus]QQD19684.1 DNA repair protein RadC [Spongiibacter nanhainus]